MATDKDKTTTTPTTAAIAASGAMTARDNSGDAKIAAAGPDAIAASGAIQEDEVRHNIDVDHPAVDNNPRAGTTVNQNAIDFNDPSKSSTEAVRENMGYSEPGDGDRRRSSKAAKPTD